MKQNEQITKLMATDLITADLSASFSHVKALMEKEGIRHLPILDGNKLAGIISEKDILKYSISNAFIQGDEAQQDKYMDPLVTLTDVMTTSLTTIKSSDTVKHAVELFLDNTFHSLPVVDENHQLVGLVSTDDVLNYFMKQY